MPLDSGTEGLGAELDPSPKTTDFSRVLVSFDIYQHSQFCRKPVLSRTTWSYENYLALILFHMLQHPGNHLYWWE